MLFIVTWPETAIIQVCYGQPEWVNEGRGFICIIALSSAAEAHCQGTVDWRWLPAIMSGDSESHWCMLDSVWRKKRHPVKRLDLYFESRPHLPMLPTSWLPMGSRQLAGMIASWMKLLSEHGVWGTRLVQGLNGALATEATFGDELLQHSDSYLLGILIQNTPLTTIWMRLWGGWKAKTST